MIPAPHLAKPISVLILDPDDQCCAESTEAFTSRGWLVHRASTFMDALELVPKHSYDVAIIEVMLPDIVGTDAWSYIRKLSPRTAGIITTSSHSLRQSINAAERGIISFLLKPFDIDVVCDLIVQTVEAQRLNVETARIDTQLQRLGGCLASIGRAPYDQVVSAALAHIPSVMKADWVVIYLLNPDRSWAPHWINHNHLASKRDWHPSRPDLLEPWMRQAVETGQAVVLGMPELSDAGHPVPGSKEVNLGALVIAPLCGRDENYGVLLVVDRVNSEQLLTSREVEFIKIVAEAIASSLDRGRAARRLAEQSCLDQATASYTTAFLDRSIVLENARRRRYHHPFSLVLLNLEGVEQYYRTRGEKLNHQVLHDAAQLAQQQLRGSDIVAHLADQQFAVLLPETDTDKAQEVAHRLAETLQTRLVGDLAEPRPELRVQVVTPSEEIRDLPSLLQLMLPRQTELDG